VGRGWGGVSASATRGGPAILSTPHRSANLSVFTDSRRRVSASTFGFAYRSDFGTRDVELGGFLTWRPALNVELSAGPSYSASREMGYLVASIADTLAAGTYGVRYIFGALEQKTLSLRARANLTFTPSLSLQLYAQPFASGASASDFRELRRPRSLDYDWYARDPNVSVVRDSAGDYGVAISRDGQVVRQFTIPNPDAAYRSLRGSAVLRWEYRPGATLFAVWTHDRGDYETGGAYGGLHDFGALFGLPPRNVFLLKVNYWLSR
jgi:hypothetical protein